MCKHVSIAIHARGFAELRKMADFAHLQPRGEFARLLSRCRERTNEKFFLGSQEFCTLGSTLPHPDSPHCSQAFRTPLVFLFWTLFQESPFGWNPHLALSTYLSTGAILVMIPAVVIYNTG